MKTLNSHKIRDHNMNDCDLQGLSNFVDCSPSLEWKIKEECDFKEEIKEEVIDDDITPFVDCDEGMKEEVKEELMMQTLTVITKQEIKEVIDGEKLVYSLIFK